MEREGREEGRIVRLVAEVRREERKERRLDC